MEGRSEPSFKLGLALSGGGFRATIFHIGALRRLAELDLLREISVISTASGGSITGAHYLLHLKYHIEKKGMLTRDDYIQIVNDMERECRHGVAKNPRSRLFLNPLKNLKIFCSAEPPGERMASLYQKHFFAPITRRISGDESLRRGISLTGMLIRASEIDDIERHNRRAPGNGRGERIPKLILNASCLNSGAAFRFTAAEVGDARLGFIRVDETALVTDCKQLLARAGGPAGAATAREAFPRESSGGVNDATGRTAVVEQRLCLEWFLQTERETARTEQKHDSRPAPLDATPSQPGEATATFLSRNPDLSRILLQSGFDLLRRAKIAAWYLLDTQWEPGLQRGGLTREEHEDRFRHAVRSIDKRLAHGLGIDGAATPSRDLLTFVLCLYYLRSARAFAWDAARGLQRLRLVDAVASSANFPPVFTPYHIHDLYDAGRVKVLSLTDGGVHDNTGMQALLDEECTAIIASDVSGLFGEQTSPGGDRLRMMGRIGGVLTAHVRNMQLGKLHDWVDVSQNTKEMSPRPDDLEKFNLTSTAFFHMLSSPSDADVTPSIRPHPHARLIASVRTDLDVFGTIEIDALIYQGYQLADRFVRRHLTEPAELRRDYVVSTAGEPDDSVYAGRVLSAARLRVGRWASIHRSAFRIMAVLGGLVLAWLLWRYPVSFVQIIGGVASTIGQMVSTVNAAIFSFAPGFWEAVSAGRARVFHWLFSHPGLASILGLSVGAWLILSTRFEDGLGRFLGDRSGGRVSLQANRLRLARFLRPWRRVLLWPCWLLPLWIALFGTVVCSVLMAAGWMTRRATSKR